MHHFYYDLYVYVKTCAVSINIITLVQIYFKKRKPRTFWQRDRCLRVLNAAVYLRDINTQFVWFYFARSAENSFTVLEEKIFIEEYFHVCMNVQ